MWTLEGRYKRGGGRRLSICGSISSYCLERAARRGRHAGPAPAAAPRELRCAMPRPTGVCLARAAGGPLPGRKAPAPAGRRGCSADHGADQLRHLAHGGPHAVIGQQQAVRQLLAGDGGHLLVLPARIRRWPHRRGQGFQKHSRQGRQRGRGRTQRAPNPARRRSLEAEAQRRGVEVWLRACTASL